MVTKLKDYIDHFNSCVTGIEFITLSIKYDDRNSTYIGKATVNLPWVVHLKFTAIFTSEELLKVDDKEKHICDELYAQVYHEYYLRTKDK